VFPFSNKINIMFCD